MPFLRRFSNDRLFIIDNVLRFFFVPIAVWPLVYNQYISFTQLGFIFLAAFLWQTVLELPSGALADLVGRRVTLVLGQAMRFVGFACVVLGNSFLWLLAAEMLDKTYEALASGADEALLYDSLKQEGREAEFENVISTGYTWASGIYTLASILGGLLFVIHPKLPHAVMLGVVAVNFVVALSYVEPKIDSVTYSLKAYLNQNIQGFKHIFRHGEIARVSIYTIAISFVFLTGLWFVYQKAANEVGLSPQYVGFLIAGLYATRAVGAWAYTKFFAGAGEQKLLWLAALQGVFSLVVAVNINAVAILGLAGRYLMDGVRQPIISAARNAYIESRYRATAISAMALITSILLAVSFPLIGWGVDVSSARVVSAVIGLVSLGVGLPVGWNILRSTRSKLDNLS